MSNFKIREEQMYVVKRYPDKEVSKFTRKIVRTPLGTIQDSTRHDDTKKNAPKAIGGCNCKENRATNTFTAKPPVSNESTRAITNTTRAALSPAPISTSIPNKSVVKLSGSCDRQPAIKAAIKTINTTASSNLMIQAKNSALKSPVHPKTSLSSSTRSSTINSSKQNQSKMASSIMSSTKSFNRTKSNQTTSYTPKVLSSTIKSSSILSSTINSTKSVNSTTTNDTTLYKSINSTNLTSNPTLSSTMNSTYNMTSKTLTPSSFKANTYTKSPAKPSNTLPPQKFVTLTCQAYSPSKLKSINFTRSTSFANQTDQTFGEASRFFQDHSASRSSTRSEHYNSRQPSFFNSTYKKI